MTDAPILKWIPYWVRNYGQPGVGDQRAVQDFVDCETMEAWRGLESELIAVTNTTVPEKTLDLLVGLGRKSKFTTYEEWARYMLGWIAGARK